jgi:hypothetical protein
LNEIHLDRVQDDASGRRGRYLAVKVTDQPWHPPVLVNGPSTTYTRVQGPWAPAIAARLAPLGAYKLLGPVVSDIGAMVGLEDYSAPQGALA